MSQLDVAEQALGYDARDARDDDWPEVFCDN